MLPTKGYFQDIECPFFNTTCGRPYCHFRHKRRPNEDVEQETQKTAVPTYKPTPKSELANIHNSKSHIPISYVPDLAFKRERTARPVRIDKPTYKPTPLSILSSASKPDNALPENHEHTETIKDLQETMASNIYDPLQSEINFEDLSVDFDLIDSVIKESDDEGPQAVINDNLIKLENDIEKEQNRLNLLQSRIDNGDQHSSNGSIQAKFSSDEESVKPTKALIPQPPEDPKPPQKDKATTIEKEVEDGKGGKKTSSRHSSKEKEKASKRREEKSHDKHGKDQKKAKHKSKRHESRKSRSKSRDRSGKKEKKHSRNRSRHRSSKPHTKGTKTKQAEKDRPSQAEPEKDPELSDVDLNLDEDDDETMRECYKIFNEYKHEPSQPAEEVKKVDEEPSVDSIYQGKKRTAHAGAEGATCSKLPGIAPPKPHPGQMLANRYKIAKLAQASNEQDNIMNEIKSIAQQNAVKRPASTLLEAARQHKLKRLERQKAAETKQSSLVDNILNGVHKPTSQRVIVKKIAAVPNVALIEKAKQRISLVKQQAVHNVKTIAQTQKSGRVAHVPEYSLADIPDVLQAAKSKLPVNVRTRFLTLIADECAKLYASKEDAFNRALSEEFACYEKCKVLATYRNSAMLAVNRLRKELQDRESKGLGMLLTGETVATKQATDFEGERFYNHMKKWLLTEEELDVHGYPRESSERGRALIRNQAQTDYSSVDENQRRCSRCGKNYMVDDDGWPLFEEECLYHPLKKRTIRREQIYLCCKSGDESGCAMCHTHVFGGLALHQLDGYQTTLSPESANDARSLQVYALDCEMCYTTKGLELTRVTIVDTNCKTVYESFVKPLNPIIDYNTRFSGITKEQMDRTSTSILQVQANILHLCNSETILVGHSLESDMKALKIVHENIIDTSVMFPHKMGLPHKRALRGLASEYLQKIIQNDVSGHDSAEDAVTCMELIKWKLKEDLKVKTK
ncbi:hypothetical protein HUJ04_008506 [Dendroctonus ponderosae]|uniref:Exonuclease domain-containing protein n=1 Tax=Dendroctonus ponderosae TaxID=77166 RepID=A0AAR5PYZ9_DENPD|nr:hypothetical protein HUJ04_008506 [Dendroctonus ponderosae]